MRAIAAVVTTEILRRRLRRKTLRRDALGQPRLRSSRRRRRQRRPWLRNAQVQSHRRRLRLAAMMQHGRCNAVRLDRQRALLARNGKPTTTRRRRRRRPRLTRATVAFAWASWRSRKSRPTWLQRRRRLPNRLKNDSMVGQRCVVLFFFHCEFFVQVTLVVFTPDRCKKKSDRYAMHTGNDP